MLDDTIREIEARLASTEMSDPARKELATLLAELKQELSTLSEVDEDRARSVAHFAAASSHEATRNTTDPALLDLSLQGLRTSVETLETEQPALVKLVNSLCMLLSNSGI